MLTLHPVVSYLFPPWSQASSNSLSVSSSGVPSPPFLEDLVPTPCPEDLTMRCLCQNISAPACPSNDAYCLPQKLSLFLPGLLCPQGWGLTMVGLPFIHIAFKYPFSLCPNCREHISRVLEWTLKIPSLGLALEGVSSWGWEREKLAVWISPLQRNLFPNLLTTLPPLFLSIQHPRHKSSVTISFINLHVWCGKKGIILILSLWYLFY